MANLKDVIYLSNEDYEVLVSTGTVTINGTTLTYDESNVYITPEELATQSSDGLMSAADKAKLDNLDTNTDLVHRTGNESIAGVKTFTDGLNTSHFTYGETDENNWFFKKGNVNIEYGTLASKYTRLNYIPLLATQDLGSSDYPWKDLYLSGTAYTPKIEDAASITFRLANADKVYLNPSQLMPASNNSLDLGRSDVKWKDVYIAGNLNDGTNSIAVANIVAKEDASNKTSTLSSTPGNTKYPTEKLLYDLLPKVIR